jgi:DNA-binding HxlR family transcriptional regulator
MVGHGILQGDRWPMLEASMRSDKNARAGAYRAAAPHPLADCPLHAAFAAVGGKWKLTILYWLAREPNHFSGLQRRVAPISHKVLTEQLRELEADGLVAREATGPVPAPVQYRLSAYGATVLPLVEDARLWGLAHLQRIRGPAPATGQAASLGCAGAVTPG